MSETTALILIIPLIILIIFSAFFSAAETAYTSVSYSKIEQDVVKGKKSAKLIAKHYKFFGKTLSTILICNNLVNISAATLTTLLFNTIIHSNVMVMIVSTFVMTPIIVIFGEIVPKLLAKKYSYGYLKNVVYLIEFLNYLFFFLTFPIAKITLQSKVTNTENELKTIISIAAREGVLEKKEATLAKNALDLDSIQLSKIITKKSDISWIKKGASIEKAKEVFRKTGHSRIPVKSGNNFIGIIIIKDIVFQQKGNINKFIIKTPYLSKNMLIAKSLEILRRKNSHLAFVVTKYNSKSVIGIVTLEDIIEELIGEIYDEHDVLNPIHEVGLHKYVSQGNVMMSELETLINFKFDDSNNTTVKKWLSQRINRKIKTSLVYTYKNKIQFKIISNKYGEETIIEITQK